MKKSGTYAHVCAGPDKSVGNGVDKLSRNAKVANLDFTLRIEENVGGFDVYPGRSQESALDSFGRRRLTTVDDTVHIIEIGEPFKNGNSDLANHLDIDRSMLLVDTVERPLVHILHAYVDVRVGDKRAVEGDNMFRVAIVHDLEFSQDLFTNCRLRINEHDLTAMRKLYSRLEAARTHLLCHGRLSRQVLDELDSPPIARTELPNLLEVLQLQVQLGLRANVEVRELFA